jgi:hypothetical protein
VEFCDTELWWLRHYRPPQNNARTAVGDSSKAHKTWVACHNIPGGIVNLLGGYRTTRTLGRDLVRKILAAELGVPIATVFSLDGVEATITPTHHPELLRRLRPRRELVGAQELSGSSAPMRPDSE